jgi:D-sedoheptulose 7-phosphate isomerase
MERWDDYVAAVSVGLRDLVITDRAGTRLTHADGFSRWIALTRDVDVRAQHVYFVGNGASAGIAGHIAADACKNGGLRAQVFNDAPLLTATGNDVAFDQVFALPLKRFGRAGDLLVTISSSGRSPNIVRALECAAAVGLHVVTLSGMAPGNPSRSAGDLNFYVPSERYGWIECAHQVVLHYWLDQYVAARAQDAG